MDSGAIQDFLHRLSRQAAIARWRFPVLLSGQRSWCLQVASGFCGASAGGDVAWLGADAPATTHDFTRVKPAQIIGREFMHAVYDLHTGLAPDTLAALAGTVRGGGLLLLLTPPWSNWGEHSRFLRRFMQRAAAHAHVYICRQNSTVPTLPDLVTTSAPAAEVAALYASSDQEDAVQAVLRVARGHRRRPAVMLADRGRGKSSALGIAAALLLQAEPQDIVLTAASSEGVAAVMHHAQRLLPAAMRRQHTLHAAAGGMLRYIAPDSLLQAALTPHLLLVDEAAALPVTMLEKLLQRHARVVFASTVHGYEGTGRGFVLQFQQLLQRCAPGWQRVTLQTPVRWSDGDPLEGFCFDVLLLASDGEIPVIAAGADPAWPAPAWLSQDQLNVDEPLLRQIFTLLLQAHYRTRPADLQSLLDDADIRLLVQRLDGDIVGVVLLRLEPALPLAQAEAVYLGRRRLQGRITSQMLSAQLGVPQAGALACARVMRIAVLPPWQGRGVGRRLLQTAADWARTQAYDVLSASFGANPPLLAFWRGAGFQPVYTGLTRDHVTGYHNVSMLLPLSPAGGDVAAAARRRMAELFAWWSCRRLVDMEADLVCSLLQQLHADSPQPPWSADECREIHALCYAQRPVDSSLPLLQRLLRDFMVNHDWRQALTAQQRSLLVAVILQDRDWAPLAADHGLPGKSGAVAEFRAALGVIAAHCRLLAPPPELPA